VVLLVSGDRQGLAAADCGLGVAGPEDLPPWGAHLLVGTDLRIPALIIEAAGVAQRMTRQNIRLSMAGTGLGALGAFTPTPSAAGAHPAAVNGAAAVAFGNGVWQAHRLPDRTEAPARHLTWT
jgi:hypothetical protein